MAMLTRLTGSTATTSASPGSPKAMQRFQKCIAAFLWPGSGNSAQQNQQHQNKSTQIDAIDCFTNDLVSRKTQKWEELRDNLINKKSDMVVVSNGKSNGSGRTTTTCTSFSENVGLMTNGMMNDLQTLRSPQLGLDIRLLSQPQLDNLLLATLEIKNKLDFLYLIRQCIRWQQLPSDDVLMSCLKYLSTIKRLPQIESLAEICSQIKHPFTQIYANLAAFKAIALWHNGSTDVALMTLHRGYGESLKTEEGRKMVRSAFRIISEETLAQKSEAVLVSLMEVARAIHKDHKDIFVMACVWKQCFVSDFYCDQKTAADIFAEYKDVQDLVAKRAGSLCGSFLTRNNTDAVHRLIEVFLEYNQRDACASCLVMLFKYQYQRKDLRACAEIVKSCNELNMSLSQLQNEQFLNLFLNRKTPYDQLKPVSFKYDF